MKTIGVLGLGIIGSAWARHYADAGVSGGVWNRTPKPDFPNWKATPEAVAEASDAIQIVVADPPAVQLILDRILPKLGPGKLVIQSSTIDPESSEKFRLQVEGRGALYLESPFTGSKLAAESRQTVYYQGGAADVIAKAEPFLSLVSNARFIIGTNKQAAALKLAMNLNIAVQMQALSESLTMVRRAGISDDVYFKALEKNASYSGVTKLKEPKLRSGDFSPQFSVKHMHKDMRLAAGDPDGAKLPLLAAVRDCLKAAEVRGLGDEDISAVIKLL
ncbi:MAG TPA: NAD(P)-dependent oxidoreductase [Opitutaceae bacterium]|nr:NAD(P)-dependent oxidoreductase [Opitutaceae bacterium]